MLEVVFLPEKAIMVMSVKSETFLLLMHQGERKDFGQ
jgi:hypothetical protein